MSRRRGTVQRRGKEKYLVRVFLGRDAQGKRVYRSETVRGSAADAQRRLTDLLQRKDGDTLRPRSGHTVATWCQYWLLEKSGAVAKSTLRNYRTVLEHFVLPVIGGLSIEKLTFEHLQGLYKSLSDRGVRPSTLRMVHSVISNALKRAERTGIIPRNPAHLVEGLPRDRRQSRRTLTTSEAALLLETAWSTGKDNPRAFTEQWAALWTLLLTTGLRPANEALALRWDDLEGNVLHVRRTLQTVGGSEWIIVDATKTASSRRSVVLPETTVKALQVHKAAQAQRILRAGSRYSQDRLMFASGTGAHVNPRMLRMKWKEALRINGLPENIRLYDTRHTHATQLLQHGVNLKVVSDRLGHASIRITADSYSHVTAEMQQETAQKVDQMLSVARG